MRIYNLDWDQGTHLHPDERYLTMVTAALDFPARAGQYWDTATSPLNPENRGFAGYVYGTLPLFFARLVGGWVDRACTESPPVLATLMRALLFGTRQPCYPGTYTGYAGVHLVGRYLSTLADLLTLIALVLLARRLFGTMTALLAGALYAFAVLPIQHAHFFVVDSFAAVFVTWTLYLATAAMTSANADTNITKSWLLLLAGITTGLAVASKISTWPVAGVVGIAGLFHAAKTERGTCWRLYFQPRPLGLLALSGLLAVITFRVAQPYAFSGPGFWGVHLNPSWLNTMRFIRDLVNGKIDSPPGHQWTARTPILFPWINMVFWGLGLPLGLSAWLGWGFMARALWREKQLDLALPWLWGTLFFLYQAVQWVKSMRYLLPVYPVFVLFAAWGLQRLAAGAAGRVPRRGLRLLLQTVPWLVLAGTMVWAAAFMQIYRRPFTRVEASRWMFENIPTAATVHTQEGLQIHLPVQPNAILYQEGRSLTLQFTAKMAGTLNALTLNKVYLSDPTQEVHLAVALANDPDFLQVLAQQETRLAASDNRPIKALVVFPPMPFQAGARLYVRLTLLAGPPVTLGTSVLGNEHWDDTLPLRIDGKDPFYDWYRGLSSSSDSLMQMYNNDDPVKWQLLHAWLEEADYIILSSNRLYGSIARLPQRYPLTVAYYRALFDGSLGFEPLAEFVSFPALGPCQFETQEAPFGIPQARFTNRRPCSVPYPVAEEAFSVYDHPRVLIFAKTPAYSRTRAEALLPLALTENAVWMTPKQATQLRGRTPLMMDATTRAVQESGGTWSALFRRAALHNRYPLLAVLLWWLMVTALGWLAFPWMITLFPALRDRGYGLARMLGILLWAYPAWLLASLRLVRHTPLLLWLIALVWVVLTGWFVQRRWERMRQYLCTHWQELLRIELLFALLYGGWVVVRAYNPDFYHLVTGGEKPMDLAYLNAVIRSSWFPPFDPWFAGGEMNYYYFGFVLIGSLIKALGLIPSIAYNLAIPTLLAMTGVGAYTLASNLAAAGETPEGVRRGQRAGLWAVALVVLLGNLGQIQLLLKGFADVGNVQFESLIPGYQLLVSAAAGFWKVVVQGQTLPFRPEWWYWNATRIIQPGPGEVAGPINEFPLFTFLYGDLHAHAIALPLTQLALGIALQWGLRTLQPQRTLRAILREILPLTALAGLVVGALQATNTWDYPTYLALMSLCFLLPVLFSNSPSPTAAADSTPAERSVSPLYGLFVPLLIWGLGWLFFRPYTARYIAIYGAVELWRGRRTTLGEYLLMHGQFIVPLSILAVAQLRVMIQRLQQRLETSLSLEIVLVGVGVILLTLTLHFMDVAIAWLVIPLGVLAALLVLAPDQRPSARVLWFWVGTALTITLVVELIVLKGDLGRMNTVFKPYMQVWMLFAITAAVAQERLWTFFWSGKDTADTRLAQWFVGRRVWLGDALLGVLLLLLLISALYPLFAIPAKVRDRWVKEAPRGLDGAASLAYVQHYEAGHAIPLAQDYAMIRWIQDHIPGSPVIMEMNAAVEYITWGNRVSIHTGLPSVVGWRWHQVQQRMVMPAGTVERRQADVRYFYDTPSPEEAWKILERYQVAYVILTPYERAFMAAEGLQKFETMAQWGWLQLLYDVGGARVYRVIRNAATPTP